MNQSFCDYFRCPVEFAELEVSSELESNPGFFAFGSELRLFGRSAVAGKINSTDKLQDAAEKLCVEGDSIQLPFDLSEVADNFRHERYVSPNAESPIWKLVANSYYSIRPILPPSLRKYVQKLYFRGWRNIAFPNWPIDDSLDRLYQEIMGQVVRARRQEIPFIWFWPDSHLSCCIITHDVEHEPGLSFALELLRIDQDRGFKSSFQLVPERRYVVTPQLRDKIRGEGFEVNVHDINHDGHLFRDHAEFSCRAQRINQYAQEWNASGFRAGSMYRNLDWLQEIKVDYDMSSPNVAHLEPQRGGCCSLFPFHVGSLIELPLTMTQDYSLYYILGSYSTELWKSEIETIMNGNGLMSLNVHPDYILPMEGRRVYLELLDFLSSIVTTKHVWQPFPKDVAHWWRQRSRLELVREGAEWHIRGNGADRASLAFAYLQDGRVRYRLSNGKYSSQTISSANHCTRSTAS